jgi:putative molybdopterin biosynthesis protein
MNKGGDQFYRAEELANVLKVNIMTIYRYIKAGKLKAYKIGKEFRIDRTEFERFLNASKTK